MPESASRAMEPPALAEPRKRRYPRPASQATCPSEVLSAAHPGSAKRQRVDDATYAAILAAAGGTARPSKRVDLTRFTGSQVLRSVRARVMLREAAATQAAGGCSCAGSVPG